MKAEKSFDIGRRESALLENECFRVLVNREKGMVPELSQKRGASWCNAHWQPWFRYTGTESWCQKKHASYWKVPLLFDIAGNFPCCPNFGPGHRFKGRELPPHGHTSSLEWDGPVLELTDRQASALWTLNPRNHPLIYRKRDMILEGEQVHYTAIRVSNDGDSAEEMNFGWHNTVGAPFLESGCVISNNARAFAVPPLGTEFDDTGRFEPGAVFDSMKNVPLREGGTADATRVPGVIGYTDFIAAAVPEESTLAWCAVINPRQNMVYFSWFAGPAEQRDNEIPLRFYNYWMNYGGRPFQPWAAEDGGTDRSFCLGAENSLSCFANGLSESIANPELLGYPTHIVLPPGESRVLYYGTAFFSYEGDLFDCGIKDVVSADGALLLSGENDSMLLHCEAGFDTLKSSAL